MVAPVLSGQNSRVLCVALGCDGGVTVCLEVHRKHFGGEIHGRKIKPDVSLASWH